MSSKEIGSETVEESEKMGDVTANTAAFGSIRDKISLFGGLNDQQIDAVLPYLKLKSFEKGACVFEQGSLPTSVFIVLSGEVRLLTQKSDGNEAFVSFIPGDCFGETSVIGIQPQLGRAEVLKQATVMELTSHSLMDMANSDKDVFSVLMMNIAREVSRRLHSFFACPDDSDELPIQRA